MKVYFQQSGGFAGITKNSSIDTSSLPPDAMNELNRLLQTSNFFSLDTDLQKVPSGAADYLKYKITVESDTGQKHTVETTDLTKTAPLAELINFIKKVGR